jgi:outer membrane immunogenic protein
MKIKLLVAAAATVVASSAMAQSAFEGFYGQVGTGYENNSYSSLGTTGSIAGEANSNYTAGNQNANGAPLVIGFGYNFSVAPSWLIGIGADYSALSQTTGTFSSTTSGPGGNGYGGTVSGSKFEASNRFNIFVTPGYEIDKDKLVYLKAGYSSVSIKETYPTYYKATSNHSSDSGAISGFSNPSSTVGGYIVGLGYKQMIAGGFYGFAEANYMSYSKPNFSSKTTSGYTISNNPSLNTYQALVGVGYKF